MAEKEKYVYSSPAGDTACCLKRQFPGRLALLPASWGSCPDDPWTQGSPGFCCVWAVPGQQSLFPAWQPLSQPPLPKHTVGAFCFWFSHFANSVTICQVLSMIFAWWKCWPYCESILTASHSEVVRQWDKFTTQADKAASIMCGTTKNRRKNENQWKYLHDGRLQAQQCMSGADWSDEGVGDSQVSLEGSCLMWLSWGCVLKHK